MAENNGKRMNELDIDELEKVAGGVRNTSILTDDERAKLDRYSARIRDAAPSMEQDIIYEMRMYELQLYSKYGDAINANPHN